jgi:hypothetical protein
MREERVLGKPPSGGSRPIPIGSRSIGVSLQPAIPRRVAPQQSPLPLHQSPTIVAQSRSGEAINASLNLTARIPSSVWLRCPVALVTSAANGVSSLLCTPGDISILRRHFARRHPGPRQLTLIAHREAALVERASGVGSSRACRSQNLY